MYRHVWVKESIKTKRFLMAGAVLHLAVAIYTYLTLAKQFSQIRPVLLWHDLVEKHTFYFHWFEPALYLFAVALGLFQYLPEIDKKRFRLSCHLPVSEYRMTGALVGFGIAVITLVWCFDALIVFAVGAYYYPVQVYQEALVVMVFWYGGSVATYCMVAAITLEPRWRQRAKLLILLLPSLSFFYVTVYNPSLSAVLLALAVAVLYSFAVLYSALRFRKGVQ
ncbi:hypothetical protein [Chrysiogenes arsenatis]|uniref:hypothetical protein n=1 Tax=Chrysiogenes arsenatis TaxID=309797 RepID=UPI0004033D3D|nr:hypothetical protein [Chrysiogenes arsenatis]